tara:strand:+ start:3982 stop:4374 length:393 start_codon:yes stop_codon:yes gene_type:complete
MKYSGFTPKKRRIKNILSSHIKGCFYCGKETENLCIDHFIPKSNGGSDHISNLMNSCRSCNSAKSNRSLEEFRYSMMCKNSKFKDILSGQQVIKLEKVGVHIPLGGHLFHFESCGYEPLITLKDYSGGAE